MENETVNITPSQPKSRVSGWGAIIGAIIIIIILIIGSWYFISQRIEKVEQQKLDNLVNEVNSGTSTEIEDIQTDLNNLDLNVLN
jgi:Ca2+/Na+ antiporter